MKRSQALLVLIPIMAALLISAGLFWPAFVEEFLAPLSLAVWLLLRLFVLSIDQRIYWGAFIFLVVVFIHIRIVRLSVPETKAERFSGNAAIGRIEFLRRYFDQIPFRRNEPNAIRQHLIRQLTEIHALHEHVSADFMVTDAFKRREIALPKNVYELLFDDESRDRGKRRRRRRRALSRREIESYRRAVEDCLGFLEEYSKGRE